MKKPAAKGRPRRGADKGDALRQACEKRGEASKSSFCESSLNGFAAAVSLTAPELLDALSIAGRRLRDRLMPTTTTCVVGSEGPPLGLRPVTVHHLRGGF